MASFELQIASDFKKLWTSAFNSNHIQPVLHWIDAMSRPLRLAAFILGMLIPTLAYSIEIDADTEFKLRCGAGLIIAGEASEDKEEAARYDGAGSALLEDADSVLAAQGVTEPARRKIGGDYVKEVAEAFANDQDPGFEPAACLVAAGLAQPSSAPAMSDDEREALLDKLMTCGAGFYVTSEQSRTDGKAEDAEMLSSLSSKLLDQAEKLMIDGGMGETARHQIGELYGKQVAEKLRDGKPLAYEWDTCASLGT